MNRLAWTLAIAVLALSACSKDPEAPTESGVCWHMAQLPDGRVRFNRLAQNVTSIEKCAVALEAMRLRFLGMGGSHENIIGAYQGQYLFLGPQGVFIAQHLNGARYLLLAPTGDGRLAKPGEAAAQR